jgi:hypothetical protein
MQASGAAQDGLQNILLSRSLCTWIAASGGDVGTADISVASSVAGLGVYLFDDEPDSWPAIQAKGFDCNFALQAESNGNYRYRASQIAMAAKQELFWSEKIQESTHPRYWFVALAFADCSQPVSDVTYTLQLQQLDGTRLSNDEEALPGLHLSFLFLWVLIIALVVYTVQSEKDWVPVQLRWLLWPAAFELVAQLMLTVHWYAKAGDGVGVLPAEALARGLHEVGLLMVWAVLVATAGGAGVNRRQLLTPGDHASLVGLIATAGVFVMDLILVLWYEIGKDPSSNEYVFDTGVGVAIVALQALLGVWFLVATRWTALSASDDAVKGWTRYLMVAGATAFVILPVVAIVGAVVPAYDRLGVVQATMAILYVFSFLAIVVMFLPFVFGGALEGLYRAEELVGGAIDEIILSRGGGDDGDATFADLPTGDKADALLSGNV